MTGFIPGAEAGMDPEVFARELPGGPVPGHRRGAAPEPAEPPPGPDLHGEPLLEVSDLRVWFPIRSGVFRRQTGWIRAVDDVSFTVARGETLGLVGESGSGKTTTGRAIVRVNTPIGGSVRLAGEDLLALDGRELQRRRRRFQMVFQDPYSSLDPRQTVGEIIGEPLEIHGLPANGDRRRRIGELLELVNLDGRFADRYPHEFSGGQRQRIGIARALAVEPELIVCDEPISALDVSVQAQVINLLERLQRELGLTYLFIAHDLAVVRHIADRVAVMYLGKLVEVAPVDTLFAGPRHPYTIALLSAVPVPDADREQSRRRIILTGDIPSPANPPSGCHFHTRCWLYERLGRPRECVDMDPPLDPQPADPAHRVACHFPERAAALSAGAGSAIIEGAGPPADGAAPLPA
ncbi:MAG: ABC transporter ATP-binding protein [Chloroflexota bacterium]